jgi:hypothetical protein
MTAFSPTEAIGILEAGDSRLRALTDRLTTDEICTTSTIGGGEWSVKDLLGHIAFWEERALATLDDWRAQRVLSPSNVEGWNADNHRQSAGQPLAAVRERASLAHDKLIAAIRSVTEANWAAAVVVGGRSLSLGERIGEITGGPKGAFDHVDAHRRDLESYVGEGSSRLTGSQDPK